MKLVDLGGAKFLISVDSKKMQMILSGRRNCPKNQGKKILKGLDLGSVAVSPGVNLGSATITIDDN